MNWKIESEQINLHKFYPLFFVVAQKNPDGNFMENVLIDSLTNTLSLFNLCYRYLLHHGQLLLHKGNKLMLTETRVNLLIIPYKKA